MPAAIDNIVIEAGAKFRREITWQDSNEDPIDLTGYSAKAQVREAHRSKEPLLTFDSEEDSIELGEEGQVTLIATPAETRAVEAATVKEGVWDLELWPTADPDDVTRLLEGKARFRRESTR